MGCPSEVEIGDNLVFSVTTHTFATGALTDADDVPVYAIYEDETAAEILSGSMAKLDDAGTLGFYTESIACTSGNGFENGKTYTIYITAAVASVTGAISFGFKAYDARKSNLTYILGTLLTETAGLIAAGFKKFFNVVTPTGTVNSLPDAAAGASGGLPTTNGTKINQTVDLTAGQTIAATVAGSVGSISGVTFPTNFGDLVISKTTGLVTISNDLSNLDAKVSSRSTFNAANDTVAKVTLVDTCTKNTDMVSIAGLSTFDAANDSVILSGTQSLYAPAKAGDKMDLVDAPNSKAVTVIQTGLSVFDAGNDTVIISNTGDIWDVAIADHLNAGSTGKALNSAGSSGDPWSATLPGAYGAGTAGNILGNGFALIPGKRIRV